MIRILHRIRCLLGLHDWDAAALCRWRYCRHCARVQQHDGCGWVSK